MHGQSSEVSASCACDGFSGLSGPQCVGFSELPEFSGAGCRAGLHLSHSSPQVPATVLFFPVLGSAHTHIHTPFFSLDPPSWAEKPGERVAKFGGSAGTTGF